MNPSLILSSLLTAGARMAVLDPEVILRVNATHRKTSLKEPGAQILYNTLT